MFRRLSVLSETRLAVTTARVVLFNESPATLAACGTCWPSEFGLIRIRTRVQLVEQSLLAQLGQVVDFESPRERNFDFAFDVLDERGLTGRVEHLHLYRVVTGGNGVDEERRYDLMRKLEGFFYLINSVVKIDISLVDAKISEDAIRTRWLSWMCLKLNR